MGQHRPRRCRPRRRRARRGVAAPQGRTTEPPARGRDADQRRGPAAGPAARAACEGAKASPRTSSRDAPASTPAHPPPPRAPTASNAGRATAGGPRSGAATATGPRAKRQRPRGQRVRGALAVVRRCCALWAERGVQRGRLRGPAARRLLSLREGVRQTWVWALLTGIVAGDGALRASWVAGPPFSSPTRPRHAHRTRVS
jgi:hypothetical protein